MQSCRVSHVSIVSSIGAGQEATLAALRAGTSGLRPCDFETVDLPTFTGSVDGIDYFRLPEALAAFDCRISQLPSLDLVVDYFRWRGEDARRNALNAHC